MTGKDDIMTIALTIESDKKFVEVFSHKGPDGKDMKAMEITYTRK